MEQELKDLKVQELSQLYSAVREFLNYLDKQNEETEKMKETK